MLISDKINQNTNFKSVKDHRENVLLAEIIKEACLLSKALEGWRLPAIAASPKSIRMRKKQTKPKPKCHQEENPF